MAGPVSHLGIDLGTTNTVAAVFDGETIELVRTSEGAVFTPSIVRIDAKQRVTVGARARRMVDRDPDSARGGFKRLMGTASPLRFPAAGVDKLPEELAAEVLRSVRDDVQQQLGFAPDKAVISVPALFELPQCSATSRAAALAGFGYVELIQEPVASALAAGWSAEQDAGGAWLVYDLGGGTFDASLLETREGLLRVIGHDGDNFLGGRDIDQAIVQWVLAELAGARIPVDRADPAHAAALRVLATAAEDVKIDLSRTERGGIVLPELFEVGGERFDVDVTIDRATVEALATPLIDRSIAVCRRLLASHGLKETQLDRIVLVGGPTSMPFLRARVQAALGAAFAEGIDPMSLVARGAAIYAATAGLSARPSAAEAAPTGARRLWLEYPTMSPDPTPFVVGRLLDGPEAPPSEVRFVRQDGGFTTAWLALGADGTLMAMVELAERRPNTFAVEGRDHNGLPVRVLPETFSLVCGMTLSDPPLSRTVGVAQADNHVRTYLERGTPLPAKRTYVHTTVAAVNAGSADAVLQIPIVQGEQAAAHLCRLVGRLQILGDQLRGPLPAGSDVEVTIEVDRGGRLTARALVPSLSQVFEQVAHLSIADAEPAALGDQRAALAERLRVLRHRATAAPKLGDRLLDAEWALQDAESGIATARGGDQESAQRARRLLIEADAVLGEVEEGLRWPELVARTQRTMAVASSWVSQLGTPVEQQMLYEAGAGLVRAQKAGQVEEMEHHLRTVDQITNAAYYRHPDAWRWQFERASSDIGRSTDVSKAQALVRQGREALGRGDTAGVRDAALALFRLLPPELGAAAITTFASGVR